jgi:hypothetical protein
MIPTNLLVFICIFLANVFTDVLACLFVRFVTQGKRIRAAIVSMAIVALSYASIIYIVEVSGYLVIPAVLGAGVGTILTVKSK